ncbi:MAG: hypothetical protein HY646_05335 [Acidobacteria bacterium]|nr:hypothetical protein [Acidobacteriota bacterium]
MNSGTEVFAEHDNCLQRYAVLAFVILLTVIYFLFVAEWISLNMTDAELQDYTHYVLGLVAKGDRTHKQARDLIVSRAQKLSLPLNPAGIRFTGTGTKMQVNLKYEADLMFPLTSRAVYRVTFAHELEYRPPRW